MPLINTTDLDQTPIRVQRLLIRLMRFNGVCEHVPGKSLLVADALSRSKTTRSSLSETKRTFIDEVESYVENVMKTWPATSQKIKEISVETAKCPELSLVDRYTREGWPQFAKDVPKSLQSYFASRSCLSSVQGVLTYLNRIVIPASLRLLNRFHAGHQGQQKVRDVAATSVWWPTVNADIQNTCSSCQFYEENKPSKPHQPLMATPLPQRPWQHQGADVCEYKKQQYLVVVDYYSRYIEVLHLPDLTSRTMINKFRNQFARYSILYKLRTNNASSFSSEEFHSFTQSQDIEHEFSSPHFSQSNGAAEAAVKIAKRCLKQDDAFLALMMFCNTPQTATGKSPAKLSFGRDIRTPVTVLADNLRPSWLDDKHVREKDKRYKEKYKQMYDKSYGVRDSLPFSPDQAVRIKTDKEKK